MYTCIFLKLTIAIVFNNHLSRLDLFGKAKEKILNNDLVKKEERRSAWEPQEIGL